MRFWLAILFSATAFAVTGNMGFNKPKVTEPDPAYTDKLNAVFDQIDAHSHAPGAGVLLRGNALSVISNGSIASQAVTSSKIANNAIVWPSSVIAGQSITQTKLSSFPVILNSSTARGQMVVGGDVAFSSISTSVFQAVSSITLDVNAFRPTVVELTHRSGVGSCFINATSASGCEVGFLFETLIGSSFVPDTTGGNILYRNDDTGGLPCGVLSALYPGFRDPFAVSPFAVNRERLKITYRVRRVSGAGTCGSFNFRLRGYQL